MLLTLILLLSLFTSQATHIRAGEIIARRIDNLTFTYEFTFIGYRDTDSGIRFGGGTFDFGDGNEKVGDFNIVESQITSNIVRAEFRLVHTFQAPNAYMVSYKEDFRNAGIANIPNSVVTTFFVETLIVIDPFFGINNTPILTVPPIDEGSPGVIFIHNAGAFDPDGDSLSYSFTTTKSDRGVEVPGYRVLNSPAFYRSFTTASENGGPATLTLNTETGDLVWDTPGDIFNLGGRDCPDGVNACAEYNIAFRVEEWRNLNGQWFRLGFVTRDMQIIVYEGSNNKPELDIPPDICVEAGTLIEETVTGFDPDGHQVKLEAFGGPFEINGAATYSPNPAFFSAPPANLQFRWQTVCGHVRERAYEVQFKVTDNPIENGVKVGPSLVNFDNWEITVVGPAPVVNDLQPATGRSATLTWNSYACPNADRLQIWRKVGSAEIEIDDCQVGMPAGTGYELITSVPVNQTSYTDQRLAPGSNYCYRLVAEFPEPGRGKSYVSNEICLTLLSDAPVITNVDIESTGASGIIDIEWASPIEIDQSQFPPPYTYNLVRSGGRQITSPVLIAEGISDTTFRDTNIDTDIRGYSYQIALFDGDGNFVDSSAVASSVRLEAAPLFNAIEISWDANVPWSIRSADYPYHYIFRDQILPGNPQQLVLYDSVLTLGSPLNYLDDGSILGEVLDENLLYCYYVTTLGSYSNPILPEPLINRSQVVCAQPNDNIPPCTPLSLSTFGEFDCTAVMANALCDFNQFSNHISWQEDFTAGCDDDVVRYRIYFSDTGLEEDFALINSVTEMNFVHEGLDSFKGCYKISAVDRSGNESPLSNAYCIDNCPNYELPNVFTPNGDGINDTFTPFFSGGTSASADFDRTKCPRFVQSVDFRVFDRTGKVIFNYRSGQERSILINWDGKTNAGLELPSGVYFYSAKVRFDQLNPSTAERNFNGWVQLLR